MGTKSFKISYCRGNTDIKLSDRRVKKTTSLDKEYLRWENQRKS